MLRHAHHHFSRSSLVRYSTHVPKRCLSYSQTRRFSPPNSGTPPSDALARVVAMNPPQPVNPEPSPPPAGQSASSSSSGTPGSAQQINYTTPPPSAKDTPSPSPTISPESTTSSSSSSSVPTPSGVLLSGETGSIKSPTYASPPFNTHSFFTALEKTFPEPTARSLMRATRALLVDRIGRVRREALSTKDLDNVSYPAAILVWGRGINGGIVSKHIYSGQPCPS